ncbi:MAG: hypothetical protein K0Q43_5242 [Ramlibacter sp.]|nr:hypothetical protein [Ramlibacter sp.]
MKRINLLALSMLACSGAFASQVQLASVPTGWKLENYVGGRVALWNTGSPCYGGMLNLAAGATQNDHSRLFAAVVAGKTAGKTVFVMYETSDCTILSFGLQN